MSFVDDDHGSARAGPRWQGVSARITAKSFVASYDARIRRGLDWCVESRFRASIVLILLCLVLFVPGVFSRPPVDRTEVRYAISARTMLETGDWLIPRDKNGAEVGRPIGILWLQALSAELLGPETYDAIWAYRLPSLAGATLAVLFLFLGMRSIVGDRTAFCAAVLMAHSLFLAIQARLALPQAGALAAAMVAQTSLARLYVGQGDLSPSSRSRAALTFWAALGTGILLNSFIVPILAALTIIGLAVQDRSLKWFGQANHALGLLLAIVIALPWPLSFWLSIADPTPDPRLSLVAWLSLVVDAQHMNYEAFPGSFVLMAWFGLLPCVLLVYDSCRMAWSNRGLPVVRFLMAWLVPYIAVLELISDKPPLYMVQYALPALAIGVALLITDNPVTGSARRAPVPLWARVAWVIAGIGLGTAALWVQIWAGDPVSVPLVAAAIAVMILFAATAVAWPHCSALAAISFSLAGGAVAYWLVIALILPPTSMVWPSVRLAELRDTLRACYPQPPIIAGYSEPSAVFLMGTDTTVTSGTRVPEHLDAAPRALAFVERSHMGRFKEALRTFPSGPPVRVACVTGRNVLTSSRNQVFEVYAKPPIPSDPACTPPSRYRCAD